MTGVRACFGSPKTTLTDDRFRFFRVRIENRSTTISIDPLLAEMVSIAVGGDEAMKAWLSARAADIARCRNGRAGLSRLVARDALRLLLAPSPADLDMLDRKGISHPLHQSVGGMGGFRG